MGEVAVGVDIGGSNVKLAAVGRQGKVYRQEVMTTTAGGTDPDSIISHVIENTKGFISKLSSSLDVEGIGFCVPCYTLGDDWILSEVTNLPSLEGYALRPRLLDAFGGHITIAYDPNAAGMAEFIWGSGRAYERMFYMGIGTGISSSFFTREAGMVGFTFNTLGNAGHIIIDSQTDAECPCGGHGCLEGIAAAPAIRSQAITAARHGRSTLLKQVFEHNGDVSVRDVAEMAERGDDVAISILEQSGRYIGIALTSYIHIFLPHMIVLGGGVSLAGDVLLNPIRRTIRDHASPWYMKNFAGIALSQFGLYAGAIGCACLVFNPQITHYSSSN